MPDRTDVHNMEHDVERWLEVIHHEMQAVTLQRQLLDLQMQSLVKHEEHLLDTLAELQQREQ
jgi:flagellar biosynthesis/type III secretory pathway chaperone